MADKSEKPSLKLIVTGDSAVGKSCLIQVYSAIVNQTHENFAEIVANPGATVGFDFISTKFTAPDGKIAKLNIWDTAGQEKYQSINRNLYLGADGALICYDLGMKYVEERLEYWRKELQENAGQRCSISIIGTKSDSEVIRDTSIQLEEYAKQNKFAFFETSAKLGMNVKEAFGSAINEIQKNQTESRATGKSLGIAGGEGGKGKSCCSSF